MKDEVLAEVILGATDSLYRISKAILKNDADCEDAVQEAIAIAFSSCKDVKQEKYAKTWLTRILIHECYRILRNRKRIVMLQDNLHSRCYENRDYSDLYQAIWSLNEKQRLTIVLFYLEGYSIQGIAEIMKTTQGTVKSRLNRARKQLKQDLKEVYYEFTV